MKNQRFDIKTVIQVLKPANEVFEAIVDPEGLTRYFISESTGRMEPGKELIWRFPEFDMDVPVRIDKVEQDKFISFYWDADGKEYPVEISLTPNGPEATVVRITEKGGDNDDAGIKWLKENTEGWANFLACLKAYLEYGINLRKGAFDFKPEK
ncbi:MAG: SRPBCC domain-containing protein [Bacteroidia bacterium]